jgi:type I restriction enzyme S subunit
MTVVVLEGRGSTQELTERLDARDAALFDLCSGAPGGVSKLRGLILEFALRGKLVPQEPSDEPAIHLVDRALAQKSDLGLRSNKTPRPSYDVACPALPRGWCWSSLGEIGIINPRNRASEASDASFVQMSAVPVAFTELHASETRNWGDIRSGFTHFAEGDVGVAKITPCFENGKSTIFRHLVNGIGAGTTELHVVRPLGGVLPEYILAFLKSPRFLRCGESVMTGSAGQKRLPRSYFESAPLPLPPIAEQRRIVARVEQLMKLCDSLEANERLADEQHVRLMSTLFGALAASDSAEALAENWQRVEEHFDLLLDRTNSIIEMEKAVLRLAFDGRLVERSAQVSMGTRVVPCGEVVDFLNGYAFKSEWFRNAGIPLARNVNVAHGSLDWTDQVCVEPGVAAELSRFALEEEAILLSLDRPLISTGLKYAVVRKCDLPCLLLQRVARLSPKSTALDSKYLQLWLTSPQFIESIDPGRSNGVPHISTRQLQAIPLRLPPLDEQRRIVARVDELRRLCAQLRKKLIQAREVQTRLADALVAQATA